MSDTTHTDAQLVLLDSTRLVGEVTSELRSMIARLQHLEARVMHEIVDGTVHQDDVASFDDERGRETGLAAHRIDADAYLGEVAAAADVAKEALAALKKVVMSGLTKSRASVTQEERPQSTL